MGNQILWDGEDVGCFVVLVAIGAAGVIVGILQAIGQALEAAWPVLKAVLGVVCFGVGLSLTAVALYRLRRILGLRLYGRNWVSWYLVWVALGFIFFSAGFALLFPQENPAVWVARPRVWEETVWLFFTRTHTDVTYDLVNGATATVWHTVAVVFLNVGWWTLVLGVLSLIAELCVRQRDWIRSTVVSIVQKVKRAIQGPTAP